MAAYVSDLKRSQALSSIPARIEASLQALSSFFTPLQKPGPGDWLATQHELGQTYSDFQSAARIPSRKRGRIYILPLDQGIDSEMLVFLKTYGEAFFQPAEVVVMETIPVDEDLYPRETWNFVFGLASGNAGVFSFCRYVEGAEREVVLFRCAKVMTHEICHMFGIKHCIYYSCAMNGSMHSEEAARRPAHLCPVCLLKLHHCLKFPLRARYQSLASVCASVPHPQFTEERDWYARSAAALPQ